MKRPRTLAPAPAPALAAALAALAAAPLAAQAPNFGLAFNLGVPAGEFLERRFPPTEAVHEPQLEGYDLGVGGQLTVSLPLHKNLAFRLGLSGMATEGTNTAAGYETIALKHTVFSISGEAQVFFENAYWHRGTYLVGGVSCDFERFERSYYDDYYYYYGDPYGPPLEVQRKGRMGFTVGVGHTFNVFTLEISYHTTLTGKDPARYEPPPFDFLKIGFGFVF